MSKAPATSLYMKLGEIELIHRAASGDSVSELRSINNLFISGRRNVVELKVPGSKGNTFQDLGRDPITVRIEGGLTGTDAKKTVETLRSKFDAGEPVAFSTNVGFLNSISKVVVLEMTFQLMNSAPCLINYSMLVKEFPTGSQKKA